MAIAVVDYNDLVKFTDDLGFPKDTKVQLDPGGIGYQYYDKWIRENVKWVAELGVDPTRHIKITESADHVGEIPEPWEIRCQKYLEGTEESNAFNAIDTTDGKDVFTHVNRQAIQIACSTAAFRYKIDYRLDDTGAVALDNRLTVAIFKTAEDTSLSYNSDIQVEQLWTTKVEQHDVLEGSPVPVLFKRAYYHDPIREDSHPWVFVGHLTYQEYEEWKLHNVKRELSLDTIATSDFRNIGEITKTATTLAGGKGISHLIS